MADTGRGDCSMGNRGERDMSGMVFEWHEAQLGSRMQGYAESKVGGMFGTYTAEYREGSAPLYRVFWRTAWEGGAEIERGYAPSIAEAKASAELCAQSEYARRRVMRIVGQRHCPLAEDEWVRVDDLLIYRSSSPPAPSVRWIWEGPSIWCGMTRPFVVYGTAPSVEEAKRMLGVLGDAAAILSQWRQGFGGENG